MKLNIVMTSAAMKKYLNIFLEENALIIFYLDRMGGLQHFNKLKEGLLCARYLVFYIGSELAFKGKILLLDRPFNEDDTAGFIQVNAELYPDRVKMSDSVFTWNEKARAIGRKLTLFCDQHLQKGMQVVDPRYASLNISLQKWYWAETLSDIENPVFNIGGIVMIKPLKVATAVPEVYL